MNDINDIRGYGCCRKKGGFKVKCIRFHFFVAKVEIDFRQLIGKSRKGFKVTCTRFP